MKIFEVSRKQKILLTFFPFTCCKMLNLCEVSIDD